MGKFVVRKSRSGYSYHFEGEDALILGYSENHKTPGSARIGIDSVKTIAANCKVEDQSVDRAKVLRNPKFEIFRDGNKKLRFSMKAKNGQQVLMSVPFKEMDELLAAIETIKTTAAGAAVQA